MKSLIIGYGVVGKSLHNDLNYEVLIHDPELGYDNIERASEVDSIFICVPTPTKCYNQDLSIMDEVIEKLSHLEIDAPIFIKSTTLPGNIRNYIQKYPELDICCAPEFLNQCQPYEPDAGHVVGVKNIEHARLYTDLFNLPKEDVFITNPVTAAFVKYVHNVHGATLVAFWHEIFDICEQEGVNYRELMYGLLSANNNVSRKYTRIAVDGKKGFGGACFPKDITAFMSNYDSKVINGAFLANHKYREEEMLKCTE